MDEWNSRSLHSQVFPYSVQSFWPAQPNALLAWIKRHEPEVYPRIGAVLMCKDYIKYCLTGEITTDFSDMSGTSLMDVRNKRYSLVDPSLFMTTIYAVPELWLTIEASATSAINLEWFVTPGH